MNRLVLWVGILGCVGAVGCGDDGPPPDGDAGMSDGATADARSGEDAPGVDTGRPDAPITGRCGNEVVEGDEECDDGNEDDLDACDSECRFTCGDGEVNSAEACDTAIAAGEPGACPTTCDDEDPCTSDIASGRDCLATCTAVPITDFVDGDLCCPEGASSADDADCMAMCDNGVLEAGELCDTAIADGEPGACPTTCEDDGDACTVEALSMPDTCRAECTDTLIDTTDDGTDGCCPEGATTATDSNCSAECGNGVRDTGERCDTAIPAGEPDACPVLADCDDGDPCTRDRLANAGNCRARCRTTAVTAPTDDDMCCPAGANETNDNDCAPVCGNNVRETGEACDDGNLDPGDGCDGSCMIEMSTTPTAFRITRLVLRDPHVFIDAFGCRDATDTVLGQPGANAQFQSGIDDYSLNVVSVFRPLAPAMSSTPVSLYTNGMCMADAPTDDCSPGGTEVMGTANNSSSGICYAADPMTLTGAYTAPNTPTADPGGMGCFVSSTETVSISLSGATITLEDAQVAGEYAGTRIVDGVIVGFLTFAEARAAIVPVPILGDRSLYSLLRSSDTTNGGCGSPPSDADDRDGDGMEDGWWMYLDFEADEVDWTEP